MIPKKIHYCWFGKAKKPEMALKCIASWKKHCSDYEIIEWNEENFDINCCTYVKEAYERKKFAFVTDFVRLYAMYTYGGIYMDTDVELTKNLDNFLQHKAFAGFETDLYVATGIMASEKGFPLFKELLDFYEEKHFLDENGNIDTTTNVVTITSILKQKGLLPNGKFQVIEDFVLYPRDYFSPLDDSTGMMYKTQNTVAIHWFNKSWIPKTKRMRSKVTRIIHRMFGVDCLSFLRKKK